MMPGGSPEAYKHIEAIVQKVSAQVDDGPCVMYIGEGGAGNYVKMVHNGIEYGDMQLISEAYDVLKNLGGLTNEELADVFGAWNKVCGHACMHACHAALCLLFLRGEDHASSQTAVAWQAAVLCTSQPQGHAAVHASRHACVSLRSWLQSELESFLVEITAIIMAKKDDKASGFLVDKIVDQTGSKGTGACVRAPGGAGRGHRCCRAALREPHTRRRMHHSAVRQPSAHAPHANLSPCALHRALRGCRRQVDCAAGGGAGRGLAHHHRLAGRALHERAQAGPRGGQQGV